MAMKGKAEAKNHILPCIYIELSHLNFVDGGSVIYFSLQMCCGPFMSVCL